MVAIYCCVENCWGSTASKHQFPNPQKNKELFEEWVNLSGNKRLITEMSPEKIFSNCRVCALHFKEEDFGPNRRLKKGVRPSLNLPDPLQVIEPSVVEELVPLELTVECGALTSCGPMGSEPAASTSHGTDDEVHETTTESWKTPPNRPQSTLMSEINVSAVMDVSIVKDLPPKTKGYKKATKLQKRTELSTKPQSAPKHKLSISRKRTASAFEKPGSIMNRIRNRFFLSNAEKSSKTPKRRRYTLEDKLLALAMYKQDAAGYRSTTEIFDLPSEKTLRKLLNRIPVEPGLNEPVFSVLKGEAKNIKNPLDKYCLLMFGEISIQACLRPNFTSGNVDGFEDYGFKKSEQIANHAQVFMLRGINRKWKQPVYFNFSSGSTKDDDIMYILKLIIRKCREIGLKVVATVCGQGANNHAAINRLVEDTREAYKRKGSECSSYHFEIDDEKIIPLFDVPQLFKGLRNNLLKYNLSFLEDNEEKLATWDHIYMAYKIDSYLGSLRLMSKLTDQHANPEKINKMKVSCCTQVFSHSVGAAINLFAFSGTTVDTGKEVLKLDRSAVATANLLGFLDKLFDSLNGSSLWSSAAPTKVYRTAVTQGSPHIQFWNEAILKLKRFKFIKNGERFSPPSLLNLIRTIQNFNELFVTMKELGFDYLVPRTFNQDPIENFFCKIRRNGHRKISPTATEFMEYYKSLLVNGLTSPPSIGANFEDDVSEAFLTLRRLVSQGLPEDRYSQTEVYCAVPSNLLSTVKRVEAGVAKYVSGFVSKKFGNESCKCNNIFFGTSEPEEFTDFMGFKEHDQKKRLIYMNKDFLNKLLLALTIIRYIFNRDLHKKNVVAYTLKTLKERISFTECLHEEVIKNSILKYLIKVSIINYTKQINHVIKGIDLRVMPGNAPKAFLSAKRIYLSNIKKK